VSVAGVRCCIRPLPPAKSLDPGARSIRSGQFSHVSASRPSGPSARTSVTVSWPAPVVGSDPDTGVIAYARISSFSCVECWPTPIALHASGRDDLVLQCVFSCQGCPEGCCDTCLRKDTCPVFRSDRPPSRPYAARERRRPRRGGGGVGGGISGRGWGRTATGRRPNWSGCPWKRPPVPCPP